MTTTNGPASEIQLLVRMDDMGSAHAINEACLHCYRNGIGRTVEVMVPAPWFMEAAAHLAVHPSLDVGVHLTLTSEWEGCKWGPLTHAPSLVDSNGFFYPQTDPRDDFPPNTNFRNCGYKVDEVLAEVRAQIQLAKRHIKQVSHITSHMGTTFCTPELAKKVDQIAREEGLMLENLPQFEAFDAFAGAKNHKERPAAFAESIRKLTPGYWYFGEHPGFDTPELRALQHVNYYDAAVGRQAITDALTSPEVQQIIREKNIKLVSYQDFR